MVKLNQNFPLLPSAAPVLSEAGLPGLDRRISDPVRRALDTLAPRDQALLDLRCGLSGESLTAGETAAEFGVSTGEIGAMTAAALRALYRGPQG